MQPGQGQSLARTLYETTLALTVQGTGELCPCPGRLLTRVYGQ